MLVDWSPEDPEENVDCCFVVVSTFGEVCIVLVD